jgi:predicted lipoprotein with Yx(FWY)xxD motif
MKSILALIATSFVIVSPAFAYSKNKKNAGATKAASAPAKFEKGILVDSKGMTLYTFDKDVQNSGKSVCNEGCIAAWPALSATATDKASGDFSIITRDDGSMQWAHKGKPLYLWVSDKKPGDMTGDKFKDVWHVIKQ